jgi:hypothetical protein
MEMKKRVMYFSDKEDEKVEFQWAARFRVVPGNEIADRLMSLAKTILNRASREIGKYKHHSNRICNLDKKETIIIYRLRTG